MLVLVGLLGMVASHRSGGDGDGLRPGLSTQATEERLRPKPAENRQVVMVPAAHQACRINHPHLYR